MNKSAAGFTFQVKMLMTFAAAAYVLIARSRFAIYGITADYPLFNKTIELTIDSCRSYMSTF